ncbi:MAG: SEC-C domain-containing protein, partial [Magnetovibrio sp.]|nr:SEC-C domain-containing protein [Magnetovibrio sp.]
MSTCPCNSGLDFDACCGPILDGATKALTAEALMRSRYTAHVKGNFDHVANTHAPEIRSTY